MKESDVIVLQEPRLSLGDQFYLPQVLIGLGTTMKHMLRTLGGRIASSNTPRKNARTCRSKRAASTCQPIAACIA